jgi:hypothetical protein
MARKNAPVKSPIPPRRPGSTARTAPPSAETARAAAAIARGMRASQLNAQDLRDADRMKTGGMCRGMGSASRGGRYGKSG